MSGKDGQGNYVYIDNVEPFDEDDVTGLKKGAHFVEYPLDNPIPGASTDRQVLIVPGTTAAPGVYGNPTGNTPPVRLGVSDAKNIFNGDLLNDKPGAIAIADFMFRSGIISLDPKTREGKNAASKAYNRAVDDTADRNQAGALGVSVMDMLSELNYNTNTGTGTGSGKSTFKQYSSYTKEQARKKAVDAFKAVLGRSPSEQEISEFANGLMKAAKAEPSIQKTTGKGSSTSQETTQGFSEKDWTLGYLSAKIPMNVDLQGASGVAQDMVAALTEQYGIKLSSSLVYDSIRDIIQGKTDAAGLEQVFKEQAKILFPHLSEKIDAGLNPRKIADAYISNTVKILEKNPVEVDLFNQHVKQALAYKDATGNYSLPTADEHARMLKNKPEWLETKNAKQSLMGAADGILRQMGFE